MKESTQHTINEAIKVAQSLKERILVILVLNVKGITKTNDDYDAMSATSEYYSYEQYEDLYLTLLDGGYKVKSYFDENDFISDIEIGVVRDHYPRYLLVLNLAQKGTSAGRKSLVPAFCQLHSIAYIGNDPYILSLSRNKYHWKKIIASHHVTTPDAWLYNGKHGWLCDERPPIGREVLIKLNEEASSIGLSITCIQNYHDDLDHTLSEMSFKYNQDILVESFISGREIEVPVLIEDSPIVLDPAMISVSGSTMLGKTILDYETRGKHKFSHQSFPIEEKQLFDEIINVTEKISRILSLRDFGRVDYRVDDQGIPYVTDISTTPHITKSMTFWFDYEGLGYTYLSFLETLIGLALKRHAHISQLNPHI